MRRQKLPATFSAPASASALVATPWPRNEHEPVTPLLTHKKLIEAKDILEHETYPTSLQLLQDLASKQLGTFHHHTHILIPLLSLLKARNYLEIGSWAGASAILASQVPSITEILAVDTCSAFPDQEKTIRRNFEAFRKPDSPARFHLYPVSSQDRSLLRHLYADKRAPFLDLLFVDGDHSFAGLAKDIEQYAPLVRPGGIIVIDDYQDTKSCPEVKRCVDALLPRWKAQYGLHVIGSLPNQAQAFSNGSPNLEKWNNEFILQKAYLPEVPAGTVGIPIATYQRPNGKTPEKLLRTLRAVKNQTYRSWLVFLIGDAYGNQAEFQNLANMAGVSAISVNLPIACEREFIPGPPTINSLLWKLGGATAMNYGLELARLAGISLVAHLDDDDVWHPSHLALLVGNLSKYPSTAVSYSKGREVATNLVLPAENGPDSLPVRLYNNFHSSVLWNIDLIPLRYNIYQTYPADADMWERMRAYCAQKGYRIYFSPTITMDKY